MAGTVLQLENIIQEDQLGTFIGRQWLQWNLFRTQKLLDWEEVQKYIFATDTTQTSNSFLPWKNKTVTPKLCQIRDNLYANYLAALFPKRKWVVWEAHDQNDAEIKKARAIENYMYYVLETEEVKKEISKLILDYIDYGNTINGSEWRDDRSESPNGVQVGYVGPIPVRINPQDIVFNPVATSFKRSPKVIRSLISMGELKELLTRLSTPENKDEYEQIFQYTRELRQNIRSFTGELQYKNDLYEMSGFTSFRHYLESDYVELLTAYGDFYDEEKDEFLRNHMIMVIDRHKLIAKKPNPSFFGRPPINHSGWRIRPDNLWAMGPLDNLVGLQYRIDHLENLKADVFDLIAFPPLKIKNYVEDFEWGPFARIHIGEDGDVEMMAPPFQILQTNSEIEVLQKTMEEMAGAPKEAMGFRTPGEKTAYEVQRLENAASRIFYSKILQFENEIVEPLLNDMLELARRNMTTVTFKYFDDQNNINTFMTLTREDITGIGRLKPIAAKHFAERAEQIQNLTNFFNSAVGQNQEVQMHFSSVKIAKMFEDVLDLEKFKLVEPYVRLAEQADAQRLMNVHMEQINAEAQTPAGLRGGDTSQPHTGGYDPSAGLATQPQLTPTSLQNTPPGRRLQHPQPGLPSIPATA